MSDLRQQLSDSLRRSFVDPLDIRRDNGRMPSFSEVMERAGKFRDSDERAEAARRAIEDMRLHDTPAYDAVADLATTPGFTHDLQGWIDWGTAEVYKLENPASSIWHKVRAAYDARRILAGTGDNAGLKEGIKIRIPGEYDTFLSSEPQVFLVQHNWAAAFAGASDFDEGEFPLPFSHCAFEFIFSGRRVFIVTNEHRCIAVTEIGSGHWLATAPVPLSVLPTNIRYKQAYENIRAICIALDAEVAVTSVTRAPHRLNIAREKQGKLPINDHHVINLARRSRVEPLPQAGEHEAKWHPRLHFRRGHWRHFSDHKTWIKWMLVGTPDLGFIDKEYRA